MPALVLLPGMDGTGTLFADLVTALGDIVDATVIAYPPDQPLGYRDLELFVRQGLPTDQPFVLLGESFSGPVAISLAAAGIPGLIGLVLCGSFDRNPLPLLRPLRRFTAVVPVTRWLARLAFPLLLGGKTSAALRNRLQAALAPLTAATLRTRLRAVLEVDYAERMQQVRMPVLYLQAMQDRIVPATAAAHIGAACPHLQLVALPGPHLLLQACAPACATAISQFAAAVVASAPVTRR